MKAYWQIRQYKLYIEESDPNAERILDGIDAVLLSLERHSWYLDETLVSLALLDPDLPNEERETLAKVLYSKPVPQQFVHSKKLNLYLDLDFTSNKPPSLLSLVGENSWFIFSLLKLASEEDKPWLTCPASFWQFTDQF